MAKLTIDDLHRLGYGNIAVIEHGFLFPEAPEAAIYGLPPATMPSQPVTFAQFQQQLKVTIQKLLFIYRGIEPTQIDPSVFEGLGNLDPLEIHTGAGHPTATGTPTDLTVYDNQLEALQRQMGIVLGQIGANFPTTENIATKSWVSSQLVDLSTHQELDRRLETVEEQIAIAAGKDSDGDGTVSKEAYDLLVSQVNDLRVQVDHKVETAKYDLAIQDFNTRISQLAASDADAVKQLASIKEMKGTIAALLEDDKTFLSRLVKVEQAVAELQKSVTAADGDSNVADRLRDLEQNVNLLLKSNATTTTTAGTNPIEAARVQAIEAAVSTLTGTTDKRALTAADLVPLQTAIEDTRRIAIANRDALPGYVRQETLTTLTQTLTDIQGEIETLKTDTGGAVDLEGNANYDKVKADLAALQKAHEDHKTSTATESDLKAVGDRVDDAFNKISGLELSVAALAATFKVATLSVPGIVRVASASALTNPKPPVPDRNNTGSDTPVYDVMTAFNMRISMPQWEWATAGPNKQGFFKVGAKDAITDKAEDQAVTGAGVDAWYTDVIAPQLKTVSPEGIAQLQAAIVKDLFDTIGTHLTAELIGRYRTIELPGGVGVTETKTEGGVTYSFVHNLGTKNILMSAHDQDGYSASLSWRAITDDSIAFYFPQSLASGDHVYTATFMGEPVLTDEQKAQLSTQGGGKS